MVQLILECAKRALGRLYISPANRSSSVSEISPPHSFFCKKYLCVHMRGWAGPVTEITVTEMNFPI